MEFYTEGLINKKPPFSLRIGRKVNHYMAKDAGKGITIMWMEEKYGGKIHAFPCLILEEDRLYHFANKRVDREHRSRNEELIKRWREIVTPENIRTDYVVEELEEFEFSGRYRELKNKGHTGDDDQQ